MPTIDTVTKIQWKPGRRFNVRATIAHKALEQIRASNDGLLEPDAVVEAARPASHPLHKCFTWVNAEAAEKWRRHEARALISSIEVVRTEPGEDSPRQVFPAFVTNPTMPKGYTSTEEGMEDDATRDLILAVALAGLNGWQQRYGRLAELKEVSDAIDRTKAKHHARPKAAKHAARIA